MLFRGRLFCFFLLYIYPQYQHYPHNLTFFDFLEIDRKNKNILTEERELHNALQLKIQDRDKEIMELKKELSSKKERFDNELRNNQATYALEKQQAILQLRQEYQEKINNKNIEIQHIKKENIDKIEKYQNKYIEYIKEMEENKLRLEKQIQDLQYQLYHQDKK